MTGYAILLLNWTDARLDGWQPFHQSRSWLAGLPFLESGTALTATTCLTLIRNAVLVAVLAVLVAALALYSLAVDGS
jgi:hypothetical protein